MSGTKHLINPPGTEGIYKSMQFSQAVKSGNTIYVSGQVGVDENFKPGSGIEEQANLAFLNLQHVLAEAGATLEDIVELVTYHTSMKDILGFSKVKAKFIPKDYPAWTAVGVTELVLPDLLVEIRATAVISG
ncbi:RidA family protein [Desulfosudis oleivorans]|uniref:Endoribonuclease L-PSP n=1 Tax=Desulfosudis oleivorans (strain DSM 6200 / JCM 39069 / Hxd3) TaxID=96561 RepID=A8ZSS7_DESOH|nr:RidA family protein [Desulfosudis oleivorans]ABW65990.1 Endoribonuclease L-PSP [Desulfosudis oleivorans Hxd3]